MTSLRALQLTLQVAMAVTSHDVVIMTENHLRFIMVSHIHVNVY